MAKTDVNRSEPDQRLLVVSNGHGEDDIACKVLASLRAFNPDLAGIDAWPMVGEGRAYETLGVPVVGPKNTLPSAGFATLDWRLMANDLKGGWIKTHWKQFRFARSIHGRYSAIIGVGDIIPLLTSRIIGTRMFFVACAKSAYYETGDGYTSFEKYLMRSGCLSVFPRDQLTSDRLRKSGVRNEFLGNPMMDGLVPIAGLDLIQDNQICIAMLPGSRDDAFENLLLLLHSAAHICDNHQEPGLLRFAVAVRNELPIEMLNIALETELEETGWTPAEGGFDDKAADGSLNLLHHTGAEVIMVKDRFAEILNSASLAIGMAGTANEQAIGLGVPLLTVPSNGVQGSNYVRMKMKFFGEAAVMAENDPEIIARTALKLLQDSATCHKMGLAGRDRMGSPGASKAIAARIWDVLNSRSVAAH